MHILTLGEYEICIDMIIAELQKHPRKAHNVPVATLKFATEYKVWNGIVPMDVLKSPKKKEHIEHIERMNAASRDPIILHRGQVIDGHHRLLRAVRDKQKVIAAYVIDDIQPFRVDNIEPQEIWRALQVYCERFNKN